eukprot:TRINITY_DN12501_c0_g1_i1.p1 TRINITY_DN12501_c0_g1~~TRINITY_DN12501_c0_g1_i1.p1  ORF type:complete len:835 (+),score=155.95 TRINITY_DN12501_c0_g1_i1:198-2702(+)
MVSQWQEDLLAWNFMCYAVVVFCLCWASVLLGASLSFVLLLAFLFLIAVESRQRSKIAGRIRYEERMNAEKKKLGDDETVAWLNHSLKTMWPLCLERFSSQGFLMQVAPWFLDKYKPWTAKRTVLHHLFLGSRPPLIESIRAIEKPSEGYTMVLDVQMNFVAARDMSAVLAVQLRKRLGFGLWTTFHLSNLQLEGKVRLGLKVTSEFPFVEQICLCFQDAPCFQLTVRPVFNYGVDVSDLPGIASWLDKMFADALEHSLVEPNMMVIDVKKLLDTFMPFVDQATSSTPNQPAWFSREEKPPIATVHFELVEAKNLKPSDLNGLADPFVKGAMGLSNFKTKIKRKTLSPVWNEDFRLPVSSWDLPNLLVLRVRDKDRFYDDEMGYSVLPVANFRGGERHLKWLTLRGVKTGKLLVAITVDEKVSASGIEAETTGVEQGVEGSRAEIGRLTGSNSSQAYLAECLKKGIDLADPGPEMSEKSGSDEYEDINIGRGRGGMLSILRPGPKKRIQIMHSGKAKNAEASAKRQYLSGDGLLDRSIRSFGGVNLNLDDDDSESDEMGGVKSPEVGRRRRFWNWRAGKGHEQDATQQEKTKAHQAAHASPPKMPEELRSLGKMGTEVIMKIEPSEEELGAAGLHRHDPVEREGYAGSVSQTGHEKQHKRVKTPMKKFGRGFRQTAHHLNHAKNQIQQVIRRKSVGRNSSPRVSLSKEGEAPCDGGLDGTTASGRQSKEPVCVSGGDSSCPGTTQGESGATHEDKLSLAREIENLGSESDYAIEGRAEGSEPLQTQVHALRADNSLLAETSTAQYGSCEEKHEDKPSLAQETPEDRTVGSPGHI